MPYASGVQNVSPIDVLGSYADNTGGGTAAIIWGAGASATPMTDLGVADKNFFSLWTKTIATSGDNRALYWRHYFNGATGGEVVRLWATANTTLVATGGTMNALHATGSIAAACTVSGAINAIRATISSANATVSGTGAAVQVDSDIVTGATVPAAWAFMRFTDSGATRLGNLFNIPAASNGTIFAAHTTQSMTHSIRIVDAAGTAYYIMCTNAATNRS